MGMRHNFKKFKPSTDDSILQLFLLVESVVG